MDSLEIDGKEYISAKRAAREHSYTMDYIGQLIRGGKLTGKKVGRAWYVEHDSLNSYLASLLKPEHGVTHEVLAPIQAKSAAGPVSSTYAPAATPVAHFEAPAREVSTSAQIATPPIPTPTREEPATYQYQMLNYVRGDEKTEDLIPNLGLSSEQPVTLHRTYQSDSQAIAQPMRQYAAPIEEPRQWPTQREESRAKAAAPARISYASYAPARKGSLATLAVGAAVLIAISFVTGAAAFFSKTIEYTGSTASITEGFSYQNIFGESR